jgi:hypothetical protein
LSNSTGIILRRARLVAGLEAAGGGAGAEVAEHGDPHRALGGPGRRGHIEAAEVGGPVVVCHALLLIALRRRRGARRVTLISSTVNTAAPYSSLHGGVQTGVRRRPTRRAGRLRAACGRLERRLLEAVAVLQPRALNWRGWFETITSRWSIPAGRRRW